MSKNKMAYILLNMIGIQRWILKMCQNFTYEVVEQRRRLKATIKNCNSKIKCQYIF
jgi:hypothetical protein